MRALLIAVVLAWANVAWAGFTICAPPPNSSSSCLIRWDCPCPTAGGYQGECDYYPGHIQVCGLDYGGGQFFCDGNDSPRMVGYDCRPLGQQCETPEDRCTLAKWELDFAGFTVIPSTRQPSPSPEATCSAQPGPNPKCEAEQRCNPLVTCCPQVGDPFSVKDSLTVHDVTDVRVPTSFGSLEVTRYFTASRHAYAWRQVIGPATPFGEPRESMHWTHTWHSVVRREGLDDAGTPPSGYAVLDTAGMLHHVVNDHRDPRESGRRSTTSFTSSS